MLRVMLAMMMLSAVPAVAQPPGGQNPSFNLVNRGTAAVRELFVTPAGNANWGQNRLDGKNPGTTSVAPGASFAVRRKIDTNCVFDVKVVFADGRVEEKRGINTCAVEDVSVGAAANAVPVANPATGKATDDPSFKLFNRAARPIIEFYATPSGAGSRGANRLGGDKISPDNSRRIEIARDGNCVFDLRVVFEGGAAKEKKRSNLCRVADLAVP